MSDHIQIGDISPRVQYVGTGTETTFTYSFPIFKDADLEVYIGGILKTLTTDYSISGAGISSGGEVTFVTAPATDVTVTLVRRLAIQRTSDFQASGEFRAKVINDELDFQTAALQQIEDDLGRALRLKRNDVAASLELPLAATRANKLIGFDDQGNAQLSTLTIDEMEQGATGPTGPSGPTGPAGDDGLFSGAEASVAPALDDALALTDTSDGDAPKFATVENVLGAINLLSEDGANLSVDTDWLMYFDTSTASIKKMNPQDIGGGGLQSIQAFTSSGTWTKPAGISKVKVTVVGGGGGGGGCGTSTGYNVAAAGGSGGGTSIEFIDVSGTSSETVTVGAAGAAGSSSGGNGGTGGTSSFGSLCSATGGGGGTGKSGDSYAVVNPTTPGSGSGGDINIQGGWGGTGKVIEGRIDNIGGYGGGSTHGGGGFDPAIMSSTNDSGADGTGYGGGGSGAVGYNPSNQAGSAGSGGIVIIEEYA